MPPWNWLNPKRMGLMLKAGTRIVKITHGDDDAHPVGTLGTVLQGWEAEEPFYLIRWDGEDVDYAVMADQIEDHQALKRIFKYGQKLSKK